MKDKKARQERGKRGQQEIGGQTFGLRKVVGGKRGQQEIGNQTFGLKKVAVGKRGQQEIGHQTFGLRKVVGGKRGQQEIVGFVLIVVVVMIGLLVFLLVSLGQKNKEVESLAVQHMISSLLKTTSECATSFEPQFDTYEALFKSCKEGERCSNLGQDSCSYLNSTLPLVIKSMIATEAKVSAYRFDFLHKDSSGESGILRLEEGRCNSTRQGAQRVISYRGNTLIVRMSVC